MSREQGNLGLNPLATSQGSQNVPECFYGWFVLNANDGAIGMLKWLSFKPKQWQEDFIDVKIEVCAIDHHDMEALTQAWDKNPDPRCVGHQIVGRVVRTGLEVGSQLSVGDQVIIGPVLDSCRNRATKDCVACKDLAPMDCAHVVNAAGGSHNPDYCPADQAALLYKKFGKPAADKAKMSGGGGGASASASASGIANANARASASTSASGITTGFSLQFYKPYYVLDDTDGRLTAYGGGLASHVRVASASAFKIDVEDQEMTAAHLARLACGGLTAWSALKRFGAGPGVEVAVLHMAAEPARWAVTFANSLRADQVFVLARGQVEVKAVCTIMNQVPVGLQPDESADMFTDKRTGEVRVRNRVFAFPKSMTPEGWTKMLKEQCEGEMDVLICTSPLVEELIPSLAIMMAQNSTIVFLDGKDDHVAKAKEHPALVAKGIKLTTSWLGPTPHMKELVKRTWQGYLRLHPDPAGDTVFLGNKFTCYDKLYPMGTANVMITWQAKLDAEKLKPIKLAFINSNLSRQYYAQHMGMI